MIMSEIQFHMNRTLTLFCLFFLFNFHKVFDFVDENADILLHRPVDVSTRGVITKKKGK